MRLYVFRLLMLLCCFSFPVFCNEISRLDDLIEATQQSLQQQKELRELLQKYLSLREQYLKNTENAEVLFQAARTAFRAMNIIQENHLAQTFDSEFLSELSLFAKVGGKQGIPKP